MEAGRPAARSAEGGPIVFAGDPHGNFSPILRACAALPPGTLILLGDCDCPAPLTNIFAAAIAAGWDIRWVLGNHDTETEAIYDNLTNCPGDLGLRVSSIGGVRIGGLPGVFKPRIWEPRGTTPDAPSFRTRAAFLASLPAARLWRGGLPLFHRDTIFPEDFEVLSLLSGNVLACGAPVCDVLVCHEAPSSHPHGFAVIDDLAAACGARLIVHGHHHVSYSATLPNGIQVRGLGLAETWRLPGVYFAGGDA